VSERVERVAQLVYDGLVIHEQRESCAAQGDAQADTVARILADAALAAGVDRCVDRFLPARDRTKLVQLRLRLAFVADARPDAGIRPPTDADVADAVRAACVGLSSFAELSRVPLLSAIAAAAGPQARALVDRLAPTDVALPGRRRVPVTYEADRPPHIASRIQDFFGLARGPTVADGAVPLVLHLLAPNQRAVQVTSDLSGFWTRHYPDLRRQLMRRYPKHAWPEDPLAPLPPRSKR
jgi:ATP-dependent helicase HrpB